jgi:tetratricopeptide (TPR) repeat protein
MSAREKTGLTLTNGAGRTADFCQPCETVGKAVLIGLLGVVLVPGCRARNGELAPTRAVEAPPPQAAALTEAAAPVRTPPRPAFVDCPETHDIDRVLDIANQRYEASDYQVALSCAELAVDAVPQSVEARHLRAAALAALGQYADAQVAFSMALALDPEDPETLAAAADFYINVLPPRHRESIQVGLEYARRGSQRALSRRHLDRSLRARLLLLWAEALNDLGHADQALTRVEQALERAPGDVEALHERAVSLFNLCKFDEAEKAFLEVLRRAPDDPYAHHHLGLIYERAGRNEEAKRHLAEATRLDPGEFAAAVAVTPEEFRAEVKVAIDELDVMERAALSNVQLELVDLPELDDLTAVQPPFAPTILGLFRGPPLVEKPASAVTSQPRETRNPDALHELPDAGSDTGRSIALYRLNIAEAVRTRGDFNRQVRETLKHELGHLRGLNEDDLRHRGLE